MTWLSAHLLSLLVLTPLAGALMLLGFPRHEPAGVRGFALGVGVVDFCLSLGILGQFDRHSTALQLTERSAWIPTWGISYSLGVDGVALLLVLLTTFLVPLVVLSTYSSVTHAVRDYLICLLALQSAMLGTLLASDLFLFYVFWEAMLLPMYFLVGIWGGQRRIYATLKFFLYTMSGSLLMLVAILYTVWALKDAGGLSFDWATLVARLERLSLGAAEPWLFAAFALAFAIKVPMFPFHTWLPDAHVEAPTGGSVILAGVMLKLGCFGFLRYALWFFPHAAARFLPTLGALAVVGVIYGALVAMVQSDLKRLVAYSSVSHLGFVMLGMSAMTVTAWSGSVLQMLNHGISTGALFLLVGALYERRHTRELGAFGGIASSMPVYCVLFVIVALSSMGLPGLNGFVGEFMILMGSFASHGGNLENLDSSASRVTLAQLAQLGQWLLPILGFGKLLWVGRRLQLARQQHAISTAGLYVGGAVASGLWLWLVSPVVGKFPGGLLVHALQRWHDDTRLFHEFFALLTVLAASGVILAAVYLLLAVQQVFFGAARHPDNTLLRDLSGRERFILAPLIVLCFALGLYPQPVLEIIEPAAQHYTQNFRRRAGLLPLEAFELRRQLPATLLHGAQSAADRAPRLAVERAQP